jgi:hypothetical protein
VAHERHFERSPKIPNGSTSLDGGARGGAEQELDGLDGIVVVPAALDRIAGGEVRGVSEERSLTARGVLEVDLVEVEAGATRRHRESILAGDRLLLDLLEGFEESGGVCRR